jgi:MFS family permease
MHDYLVGPLLAFHNLAFAVVQPPAGKLSDLVTRRSVIILGFATTGFGFSMLVFASSFLALLTAIVIVEAGLGQISVSITTAIMDLAPSGRGGLFSGFQNVGWGIGYFAGSFFGGFLALHSPSTLYLFGVFASACALF